MGKKLKLTKGHPKGAWWGDWRHFKSQSMGEGENSPSLSGAGRKKKSKHIAQYPWRLQ